MDCLTSKVKNKVQQERARRYAKRLENYEPEKDPVLQEVFRILEEHRIQKRIARILKRR